MAADPSALRANVSLSPPTMASDLADEINRHTLARTKLGKELEKNHECILEAIERKDRTVKIKKWLEKSQEYSEKAVSKNEEILPRESDTAALDH